jgi:hypothetical protein
MLLDVVRDTTAIMRDVLRDRSQLRRNVSGVKESAVLSSYQIQKLLVVARHVARLISWRVECVSSDWHYLFLTAALAKVT